MHDKPLGLGQTGPSITVTDEDVQAYQTDLQQKQSVVAVQAGEVLTQYQALQAMLIPSGNNIAELLARWDAGSVQAFIDRMNERARSLGDVKGELFMALEQVDGVDVATLLSAVRAPLLPGLAALVAHEICRALSYAQSVSDDEGRPLSIVHREAVNRGKIAGPRYFISIGSQSANPRFNTGFEPPLFPDRIPKSPAEARQITKRFVDAGADFIFFQDASLPLDIVAASIDEAKKAGKPIALERVSSTLTLTKAVEMGIGYLTHSPGVAETIAKDPSKWRNELDLYADMDEAKAQALIKSRNDFLGDQRARGHMVSPSQTVNVACQTFTPDGTDLAGS